LEMDAVVRSLEAHIGTHAHVDIAEFLSVWRCASGIRADVDLTPSQVELSSQISRLLGAPRRPVHQKRFSVLALASGSALMNFFTTADIDGDGYMSVDEGVRALEQLLIDTAACSDRESLASDLHDLLTAVDTTGGGRLNYLEFLRLFDRQDPHFLIHQSILDALCFQVWVHRNSLSGLFRHIGSNGRVTEEQIRWALYALNCAVDGQLVEANIASLVAAVNFTNGTVGGEEFLHAFELFDYHRDRR